MKPSVAAREPRYIFHGEDWFSRHIPVWQEHLGELLTRNIRVLEIGSYEGRSTCWILENLRHPKSIMVCVDTWDGKDATLGESTIQAEKAFDYNTEPYRIGKGSVGRLHKVKLPSLRALAGFIISFYDRVDHSSLHPFHLIHIDGCHEGLGALTDLVMAWPLLAPGGYLVFDDYLWVPSPGMNIKVPPSTAWDAFAAMQPGFEMVHQHRQCIVRKI